MIFEIYGQAYRIRFHHTTSEIKLRLASECGILQRFAILYAIRMTRLPMRQPAPELAYCLYAFLQRQWPKYYSRPVFVNYAGFRAVSKDRRLCAKYGYTGVLRKDTFVRTTRPRPRSEALLRWQSKRRSESTGATLAKLLRTLSLRDGLEAHWAEPS